MGGVDVGRPHRRRMVVVAAPRCRLRAGSVRATRSQVGRHRRAGRADLSESSGYSRRDHPQHCAARRRSHHPARDDADDGRAHRVRRGPQWRHRPSGRSSGRAGVRHALQERRRARTGATAPSASRHPASGQGSRTGRRRCRVPAGNPSSITVAGQRIFHGQRRRFPCPGPNGLPRYYLDMGWEDIMVAVEYDGEHHRKNTADYRKDIIRLEYIQSLGWIVVRVVAGNRPREVVERVRRARALRLR